MRSVTALCSSYFLAHCFIPSTNQTNSVDAKRLTSQLVNYYWKEISKRLEQLLAFYWKQIIAIMNRIIFDSDSNLKKRKYSKERILFKTPSPVPMDHKSLRDFLRQNINILAKLKLESISLQIASSFFKYPFFFPNKSLRLELCAQS